MPVETAEQMQQLMMLQSKETQELQAICEGLDLDIEGKHEDLVRRLVSAKSSPQIDVTKAQAIPLRTRDEYSEPIEDTKQIFLKWRKMIFEQGGRKAFKLLNNEGRGSSSMHKYIKCSPEIAQHIVKRQWFLPLDHQKDLIKVLAECPENFILNIVQKPDTSGNSWLMLHVEPVKKAA